MTQEYYGTKKVTAWEEEREGKEGYAVKYEDGYISWSPKDVFEKFYQNMESLSFGHALEALKNGEKVQRAGWNGKAMWLELQSPDDNSKMTLPYLYLNYPDNAQNHPGARVPWLASQTDMLANDWRVIGAIVHD